MKRTLALTTGIMLSIIPTLHADHGHFPAFSNAPHIESHVSSAPTRSFAQPRSFAHFTQPRSFAQPRSFSYARPRSFATAPHYTNRSALAAQRNFQYSRSKVTPSFAFGGHVLHSNQPGVNNYNYRYNNANRFTALAPNVSRDWDRHHDHAWNHHRYRWVGNYWALIDGGYDYPYNYYPEDYDSAPYVANTSDYNTDNSLGAEVQQALAAQGYYHYAIDGDIGPVTRDAIAQYQRDHRLPVTGTITTPLLDSLGLD